MSVYCMGAARVSSWLSFEMNSYGHTCMGLGLTTLSAS